MLQSYIHRSILTMYDEHCLTWSRSQLLQSERALQYQVGKLSIHMHGVLAESYMIQLVKESCVQVQCWLLNADLPFAAASVPSFSASLQQPPVLVAACFPWQRLWLLLWPAPCSALAQQQPVSLQSDTMTVSLIALRNLPEFGCCFGLLLGLLWYSCSLGLKIHNQTQRQLASWLHRDIFHN